MDKHGTKWFTIIGIVIVIISKFFKLGSQFQLIVIFISQKIHYVK